MFLGWMELNKTDPIARSLTYAEFPTKFVWNKDGNREWSTRKQRFSIGRVYYIPPGSGELYYLSALLNTIQGATCYEDIRTVNGVLYSSFKEACYARGLLDDDKEYIDGITEASFWGSAQYLRSLFVTLLLSSSMSRPEFVWEQIWKFLGDDILHRQKLLMQEEKEYVLEEAMPEAAGDGVTQAALNRWIDANKDDVKCLMLATMSADLQKTFINSDAFAIISELKNMFQDLARVERFETHRKILETKLKKGEPVSPHVLKIIGLIENMSRLDQQFSQEMAVETIIHSLHSGYDPFKLNYSMNSLDKTLTELHGMLKTAEKTLKSDKQDVLMVRGGKFKKSRKKRNAKKGGKKASPTKQTGAKSEKRKVSQPTSESECFYCKKKGHWKRDCLKLKEDQKKGTVVPSLGTKKK
ncbi:uncharacterized protein [Spinacia oleracea]|uniref:Uncharacterized protein isoform X2 n=1 Tax=Spinacia oleracea TaxID=3562 RepID=A0ABM3R2N1_SPIOL|nr:uncharacterized protein LOC130464328 isoform X2 [Spinacia oleracea]